MKYKYVKMICKDDLEPYVYFRINESNEDCSKNASTSKNRFSLSSILKFRDVDNYEPLEIWRDEFQITRSIPFKKDFEKLLNGEILWDDFYTPYPFEI